MRLALVFLSLSLCAQTRNVVLTHAPSTIPAALNMTITALPNTVGGTTVNLSSATADWRLFANTGGGACLPTSCFGDRAYNGSGIMGVFNQSVGLDPPFYPYGPSSIPALTMTWSDGALATSGALTGNNLYVGNSYQVRAPADNGVTKTLTSYWGIMANGSSQPNRAGTGTVQFTAHLTDGSVVDSVQTISANGTANGLLRVVIQVTAATDGQEVYLSAIKTDTVDGNTNLIPIAAMLDSAATGPITRSIPPTYDVQQELDAARPGDTLVFPASTRYGNFALNRRPVVTSGGVPLHIKIKTPLNLPTGQTVLISEPVVTWASQNEVPALVGLGPSVAYWDLDGIYVYGGTLNSSGTLNVAIQFGLGSMPDHTTTTTALPHDISLTHMVIRGRDGLAEVGQYYYQQVGIYFDVLNGTIADSNITNWVNPGAEANAISISSGKNITIRNCELTAAGEVIMMNNAYIGYNNVSMSASEWAQVPLDGGLMPDGITIVGNYVHKDLTWLNLSRTKNLIEFKTAKNSHAYNNVLKYSFEGVNSEGQHGAAFVVTNRMTGLGDGIVPRPASVSHDIEIDHNIIAHVGSAIQTNASYDDKWSTVPNYPAVLDSAIAAGMGPLRNISFHDNLVRDISVIWTSSSPGYPAIQRGPIDGGYTALALRWGFPANSGASNNTFLFRELANTVIPAGTDSGISYNSFTTYDQSDNSFQVPNGIVPSEGLPIVGNVFNNNVFSTGDPHCDNSGSFQCFSYWNVDPGTTLTNNNFTSLINSGTATAYWASENSTYPGKWTGNTFGTPSTGQGVNLATLPDECAVITGNRSGVTCTPGQ